MTQRMDKVGRAHAAAEKAEKRLRALPKKSRQATRDKLIDRICANQLIVDMAIDDFAERIARKG